MALSVTSTLTTIDECDADNWTGDPTVGLDTDFYAEPTGSIAYDVDIETLRVFSAAFAAIDLSNNHIYAWMMVMTAPTVDTRANGGMQLGVEDGAGNQSFWYVGGNDDYSGGWDLRVCSTANTPNWNNGTVATLTNIVKMGVGYTCTAKSKLADNCYIDWIRYGNGAALKVKGTNTTTDEGWSEVLTRDKAAYYGVIKSQAGGYILKGPIQIGDDDGTLTTNFTDTGTSLVWINQPVANTLFKLSAKGNGTGTTDIRIGNVVGTGDDRKGVLGGTIDSASADWKIDFQTDIATLDTIYLYGININKAKQGVLLDDSTKTKCISCSFVNCGEIDPGTLGAGNGAELLSISVIDPQGGTNNRGLRFNPTHSIKKVSFITSGTPTTQNMAHLPSSTDYTVAFNAIIYYGNYASGTLYHGENSGTNADVILSATSLANPDAAEFQSTAGGTVVVSNDKTLAVHVEDESGSNIQNAQVYIQKATPTAFTADIGNNAGDPDLVVNETVDTDIPGTGWVIVWGKSANEIMPYRYASWTVKTFSFPTEATGTCTSTGSSTQLLDTGADFGGTTDVQEGDTIRNTIDGSWAVVDEIVSSTELLTTALQGGTDDTWELNDGWGVHKLAVTLIDNDDRVDIPLMNLQTNSSGDVSKTYNYGAPLAIKVRVRYNSGATKYIPFNTSGTITGNYDLTVVMLEDAVAT